VAVSLVVFLVTSARRLQFVGEAERYVSYSLLAQFALLAVAWARIPAALWWALVAYNVVMSVCYQGVFVMLNWKPAARRDDGAELREFFLHQPRTLRILPIAEGPHILAYMSGHEVFYPCGNFQVWYTSADEYVKLYEELPRPRTETLPETLARYGIDTVLVNKRNDKRRSWEHLGAYPVLFQNDSFVLFDVSAIGADESRVPASRAGGVPVPAPPVARQVSTA
jgi:hypothetical protein